MRSLSVAVGLIAAAFLGAPVAANALVVPLDHSQRLSLSGSASSVLVGNPAIADVTVVDSHTLYLQGKSYGVTNLVVLDRAGRTLYLGDIRVPTPGASVSVYRGGDRADFGCTPRCSSSSVAMPVAGAAAGDIFAARAPSVIPPAQPINAALKTPSATPTP